MANPLRLLVLTVATLLPLPAAAQVSTGTIAGRIVDAQGAAVPGVSVQAVNPENGFERIAISDGSGVYRLAALPVGTYDFAAEISGFKPFTQAAVVVNISRTVTLDAQLELAGVVEGVSVTATTPPLVSQTSSSVGQVVDLQRIQSLPINGRQFANLAATVPGVGLGFHSDSTKSGQYTPQISGGNGRNVNYVVDGGDNNDDTVGGLLQLFPLEAIQEFDVVSQRFDAEYGRSNGGVLNVVTKSGTNTRQGSLFSFMRDRALNGETFTEQIKGLDKQDYRRYQFGGSLGGPIVRDRVHYFAAYERTQQDTNQLVDTLGLFPEQEGIQEVPLRQNLLTAKVTASPAPAHYLSIRYGHEHSSQPGNAGLRVARSAWSTSTNTFHSLNVNHNWVVGQAALNEVVVQYSDFVNDLPASGTGPSYLFMTDLQAGSTAAPQRTEQRKWQLRNDYSWSTARFGGLAHELKAGVNWVHEPTLRVFTGQGLNGLYQINSYDLNAPVFNVIKVTGDPTANFPIDLYGFYVQDDWRVNDRLTLNLGVRWDYVSGVPLDQSTNPNFIVMQAAGRSGRFAGTLLEDFGHETRSDKDNVQPRVGAVYDIGGDGRHIVRGGWGIYTDFGYTASNALTAALDTLGAGMTFNAFNAEGLRKRDNTLFRFDDPIEEILHLNTIPAGVIAGTNEVVSPLLEQPYTLQTNLGYAHQLTSTTTLTVDYVRADGRDLNVRVRPNVRVNNSLTLAGLPLVPGGMTFRTALSKGSSRYDAGIFAVRRRLSDGIDVAASYTLSKATSNVGSAYDEIASNLIQNISDPFGPVQQGPSARTDSRHAVTISAIVQAPYGINIAPIIMYRSALPVHTFTGTDVNADGIRNDRTPLAYRYTGLTAAGRATFEEDGPCETVNCSRRAGFSQVNIRISKSFALARRTRLEATAEIFNLLNAKNPSFALTQNLASGASFMQPNGYAGDLGQPEQRVGQLGLRLSF